MDAESKIQSEMREIRETDERRNDLEGYIFLNRDKVSGDYAAFIAASEKDTFLADLQKAEDWLYDNFDAKKVQYVEKLSELKKTGDVVQWRWKENQMRAEWIAAVQGTVKNYLEAASEPGDKYDHIAKEKLQSIIDECKKTENWLNETLALQEKVPDHEKPVLMCSEMEKKIKELAHMADEILKERKPAPPPPPAADDKAATEKKEEVAPESAPEADKEVKKEDGKNITVDDVD